MRSLPSPGGEPSPASGHVVLQRLLVPTHLPWSLGRPTGCALPTKEWPLGPIPEAIAGSHLVNRVISPLSRGVNFHALSHQRLTVLLGNVTFLPIPLQELSPRRPRVGHGGEAEGFTIPASQTESSGPELVTFEALPLLGPNEPYASPLPLAREEGPAMT